MTKTKKIYLAGPWFTEYSSRIENEAFEKYKEVENESSYTLFRPRKSGLNSPYETFLQNLSEINKSDLIVALISEKDVGTSFEIGYARALGKDIILVGYIDDFKRKTNLMLAFAGDQCITIDKLTKLYTDKIDYSKDAVDIDFCWGNIE